MASLSSKVPRAAAEPFDSRAGSGLVALLCIRPYAVCMIKAPLNLLDHRFLTRVGNLRTLLSIGGAVIFIAAGFIVAAVALFSNAGTVPLVFVGVGVVILGLVLLRAIRSRWSRSQKKPNATIHAPKGRIPPMKHRHDAENAHAMGINTWQLRAARATRQPASMSASVQQLARAADYGKRQTAEELAQRYHDGKALRTQINLVVRCCCPTRSTAPPRSARCSASRKR